MRIQTVERRGGYLNGGDPAGRRADRDRSLGILALQEFVLNQFAMIVRAAITQQQ